jgi:hypothetical protein
MTTNFASSVLVWLGLVLHTMLAAACEAGRVLVAWLALKTVQLGLGGTYKGIGMGIGCGDECGPGASILCNISPFYLRRDWAGRPSPTRVPKVSMLSTAQPGAPPPPPVSTLASGSGGEEELARDSPRRIEIERASTQKSKRRSSPRGSTKLLPGKSAPLKAKRGKRNAPKKKKTELEILEAKQQPSEEPISDTPDLQNTNSAVSELPDSPPSAPPLPKRIDVIPVPQRGNGRASKD